MMAKVKPILHKLVTTQWSTTPDYTQWSTTPDYMPGRVRQWVCCGCSLPLEKWREKIHGKADEIDPGDNYCWKSLAIGFALAHDFTIDEAAEFYSTTITA